MKKKLFTTSFLTAIIIIVLVLFSTVHLGTAQSGSTTYIVSGYVFDPSGQLVSGASVYLVNGTGHGVSSGQLTGSSGYYYVVAPAGTYWLVASGPSGSSLSYSVANFVVSSDITRNVTLISGFKISGYILDSSGKGVAGVQTNIYNASWSVPSYSTNSTGFYTVTAPAGTYTFIVWPPYNTNTVNYDNPAFVVNSDMNNNITLTSGFKVSGYVLYPSGIPVSGVTTYLVNSSGSSFGSGHWSDSTGYYYAAVPAGTYTLTASGLTGSGISYSTSNLVVNSDVTKNMILITVSILPSSGVLDVGQSQLFNATPSGGSGNYTLYQWYVDGSITSVQRNSTFNYSPASAGSYVITTIITDSSGATSSQSTTAAVTVNSALTAPTLSVSRVIVDQGQTSVLTSTVVSTGTSPYSYQWLGKAPGASSYSAISGANASSYSFVTSGSTAVGSWSFELNVTDSASTPVTITSTAAFVTVNLPPTVSVFPGTATLDVSSSKTFIANTSGGSGSLSYQWFLDGTAVGNNSTSYSLVATMGSHSIYVNVTDSASTPTWAPSNIVSVTVNYALVAPLVSASIGTIDQGQTSNLTSTAVINGTSPYSYQWLGKAPGASSYSAISGANASSYSFVTSGSTAVGSWSFELNVTDSASTPVTITSTAASVIVNVVPSVSVSPGSAAMDVNQSQLFTAAPIGGSSNYTAYQWYVNGSVKSGQIGSTFSFVSTSTGSFLVTVTVTDSLGATSVQSPVATVTVNPALIAPIVTPTPSVVDQSRTSTLTSFVTTGTPSYLYQWYCRAPNASSYSLIGGAILSNYSFVTSLSNATGIWSFEVQVTDATGEVVNSTAAFVTVNPALTISSSPGTATLDVGQSQTFTANAGGGSGTYTSYQWYVGGISQAGQTASTFNYSPASSGSYSITATVTDSLGTTSVPSSAVSVTVNIVPSVSLSPSSWTMNVGQSKIFTATASGGSGTYTSYQWYVGGISQAGQTASTFNYSPASSGSYSITATVTDSLGTTSTQSAPVSVAALITPTPTPTASPTSTIAPTPTIIASPSPTVPEFPAPLIGIALVVSTIIVLLIIIITKRKQP